jgi:hypothetical protein
MKKIISALVVACAIIGYVACGEPKPATGTSTDNSGTMQNNADTSMQSTPSTTDTTHH